MKIREITMTPADAAKLLEHNTRNRKCVAMRVATLTGAIERGEWVPDGNPIKVSAAGVVLDGQHRLSAIAAASKPVPVILMEDLTDDAQLVMDSGKSRTFADYLQIKGVANALNMAAACRMVWSYEHGLFSWKGKEWFSRPMPTNAQLWELFARRREELELGGMQASPVLRVVRVSRAVMSGGWVILGNVECDRCGPVGPDLDEFYELLAMRKAGEFDSINLFIKLMNGKDRDRRSSLISGYSQGVQLALFFKTWNAYREGRTLTTLKFVLGGKSPEKFPVPH